MLRFVRTTAAAATSTYKGMAVQKPGEEFKLWEYQAGPMDPNDVEIKVSWDQYDSVLRGKIREGGGVCLG
jgi:hypothetical protein